MPYISDEVFDQGLDYATTNGIRIDVTSVDCVGTYACVTTNTVANSTAVTGVTANATSTGLGRKVTVAAIVAGSVTTTGNAKFWALNSTTGSTVIASGALTATQAVTSGNTFSLDAIKIIIRDAA